MNTQEQENTRIVRQAFEAFARRDILGVLSFLSEDIDWWVAGPEELPYAGTRHGLADVREHFAMLDEVLTFEAFEAQEFIAQDNQVVVLGFDRRRFRGTGWVAENPWAMVCTMCNGKICRFRAYEETGSALTALRAE